MGKQVRVACSDPIPPQFSFLLPQQMPDFAPQCVATVDVADPQLLGSGLSCWSEKVDLCIDHHPSNRKYAQRTLLCADAAATAEIMIEVIRELGVQPDQTMANCIYTGLCTDTGCFQYSNVTSHTLRVAADMIDLGADAYRINRRMFGTKSKGRIAMEREVLDSLTYAMDGKIALIAVTSEMLARTGTLSRNWMGFLPFPAKLRGCRWESHCGRSRVDLKFLCARWKRSTLPKFVPSLAAADTPGQRAALFRSRWSDAGIRLLKRHRPPARRLGFEREDR